MFNNYIGWLVNGQQMVKQPWLLIKQWLTKFNHNSVADSPMVNNMDRKSEGNL